MAFQRPHPAAGDELLNDGGYAFGDCRTVWPDRCVLCNAPATGPRFKEELNVDSIGARVLWRSMGVYALLFSRSDNLPVLVSLCPAHGQIRKEQLALRRRWMLLWIVSVVAGLTISRIFLLLGLPFMVLWLWQLLKTDLLIPAKKIKDGLFWASPSREFVMSLPLRTAQSRQKGGTSPVDDDLDILESDTPELR